MELRVKLMGIFSLCNQEFYRAKISKFFEVTNQFVLFRLYLGDTRFSKKEYDYDKHAI